MKKKNETPKLVQPLNVEIPDELHRKIKAQAALAGIAMKEWCTAAILCHLEMLELEKSKASPQQNSSGQKNAAAKKSNAKKNPGGSIPHYGMKVTKGFPLLNKPTPSQGEEDQAASG